MSGDVDFRVTGIAELLAGLGALDQKGLAKLATASMKRSTKGLQDAIKRDAPRGPEPHASARRGKRGKKGPLSRTVTTRTIRKRQGEMVALQVGPRAWYKHFVIRGTRRHVIEATDSSGARAGSDSLRRINRFAAGGYTSGSANSRKARALAIGDSRRFVFRVHHRGARGNDFVSRAARGRQHQIRDALARDIATRFEAASRAA